MRHRLESQRVNRDKLLQRARRLHLFVSGHAVLGDACNGQSLPKTMDRREMAGLIAEFDGLICALEQEVKTIGREIDRTLRQADAMLAYSAANRLSSTLRPACPA